MDEDVLWRQIKELPPERVQEVADYVAFLATRVHPTKRKKAAKKTPLMEEPCFGMWKDREDMPDGATWVRELRRREWNR